MNGNAIDFTGYFKHEALDFNYYYSVTVQGDTMKGKVDMGEFVVVPFITKRKKK